ncbi:MAG: integrin alpha, partial [Candidatus Zixiibacteriota bacterium]
MRRVGLISLVFLVLSYHTLSATSLKILAYFRGENYGDKLGYKVAPAGDVNLDGYADVFVGASGADKVYLYYGGSPMDTTADLVFNKIIYGLWDVGVINGDGYSDVVMGDSIDERVQFFYGGAVLDTIADLIFMGEGVGKYGDNFGSWVSGGMDVNGDGQNDLLIAANKYGQNGAYDGRVYLYHGGSLLDTTADWMVTYIDTLGHNDAWSAEIIGDVNSDGFADIGVGSIGNSIDFPGKVYIYFGGSPIDTLPDLIINSPGDRWAHFGAYIAPLGDINKDGYDDFVVAGVYPCVYFGGEVLDSLPGIICQYQGKVACNAGDINHDGYDDLLVGYEHMNFGSGAVFLYYGSEYMDSICDLAIYGGLSDFEIGKSVAGLGDVDGDGVDDFIVGARSDYDPWDRGEAWIFAGDSTLPTDVEEEGHE